MYMSLTPDKFPLTVICTNSGVFGEEHRSALESIGINPRSISREIGGRGDKVTVKSDLFGDNTREDVLNLLLKTGKFRRHEEE